MTDIEHPNNNPYQEPPSDELTIGQALRTIAERTAFRSERERDAVYAAIEAEHGDKPVDAEDDKGDEQVGGSTGDSPASQNGPGSATTPSAPAKRAAGVKRR